jgi:hypothetical protein
MMQISFSSSVRPYFYNCPYAFKLRNIDKIYPSDVLPKKEETEEVEQSTRQFGIEQHDLAAAYIKGDIEEFDYTTDTIEHLRNADNVVVETTRYLSLDLEPLARRPESGDFISYRTDATELGDGFGKIYDFKFGNPDYGSSIYYDEVEFFLLGDSIHFSEIGEWSIHIHFPINSYTLPVRTYTVQRLARLQDQWMWRLDQMLNDKFYAPKPSRVHCKLCDYRRVENGGCGVCEYSVE